MWKRARPGRQRAKKEKKGNAIPPSEPRPEPSQCPSPGQSLISTETRSSLPTRYIYRPTTSSRPSPPPPPPPLSPLPARRSPPSTRACACACGRRSPCRPPRSPTPTRAQSKRAHMSLSTAMSFLSRTKGPSTSPWASRVSLASTMIVSLTPWIVVASNASSTVASSPSSSLSTLVCHPSYDSFFFLFSFLLFFTVYSFSHILYHPHSPIHGQKRYFDVCYPRFPPGQRHHK